MSKGIPWPFLAGFGNRLFLSVLFLILLAQAIFVFILYLNTSRPSHWRQELACGLEDDIKKILTGRSLSEANFLLTYFNFRGPQLWFESLEGEVLAGEAVSGLGFQDRMGLSPPKILENGDRLWNTVADWETGPDSPLEMIGQVIDFKDGPALMCFAYWSGLIPYQSRNFYRGSAVLIVLGALLSLLVARQIAAPLDRLRSEVLAIDGSHLDRRVSERGPREVRDVARSVNALAQALEKHDRRLRELSANVSHELRSPLMRLDFAFTFMGRGLIWAKRQIKEARSGGFQPLELPDQYLEQAEMELESGCPQDFAGSGDFGEEGQGSHPMALAMKYHGFYRKEIRRMEELINATLLSNKLDLGHGSLSPEIIDLSSLCQEQVGLFRPIFAERDFSFSEGIQSGIYYYGEKYLLERLVLNILDNAAKYTNPGGKISFGLSMEAIGRQEGSIFLSLENSCQPIGEKRLSRLFEPFFRGGLKDGQGVGLGLSLAKKIVDIHCGNIAAFSTAMGFRLDITWPGLSGARQRLSA
jgi:signal transduction histidine kinase